MDAPALLASPVSVVSDAASGLVGLLEWVGRQLRHTFFNRTPTTAYNPAENSQSVDGVITGDLRAVDPDGDPLTFTSPKPPSTAAWWSTRTAPSPTPRTPISPASVAGHVHRPRDDGPLTGCPVRPGCSRACCTASLRWLVSAARTPSIPIPTVKVSPRSSTSSMSATWPGRCGGQPRRRPASTSPTACDDTVSVIDTATNTVIDTIRRRRRPARGGGQPRRRHRLRHTTTTDGTVSVIDTATNTVIDTITVDDDPTRVAVSPDGATVYVHQRDGRTRDGDRHRHQHRHRHRPRRRRPARRWRSAPTAPPSTSPTAR